MLDEVERLKHTSAPDVAELLSMLTSGYKKGGQATRLEAVGKSFRTIAFDVYGPKALACISGLPPALASRCIPLMMFRAAPGSHKPRRRIDSDREGWQTLRDDLHVISLEHAAALMDLPQQSDVCPRMSGRDYELWQPILALASWIESHGGRGLLDVVQQFAIETIDQNRDDQTPDQDETLLRVLANEVRFGLPPTPGEILSKAKQNEPEAFRNWTARAVATHIRRYGLVTHKSHGRKLYNKVTIDELRQIQTTYSLDLGIDDGVEK